MKYIRKGMSVVELEELKSKTTSYKQKQKINTALSIAKKNTKLFTDKLLKSKWWKLGIERTIRKKQAKRVLVVKKLIYILDPCDIVLNLIELTLKAEKISTKSFCFTTELNKL